MTREKQLDLIRRFRGGDEAAFRQLLTRYDGLLARRIRRSIPKRLRRRVTTQDVVQETCLAAYRGRDQFRTEGVEDFRRWLLTIADNKLRDLMRHHLGAERRKLEREVTRSSHGRTHHPRARATAPDAAMVRTERRAQLQAAIETLPSDYREVLRLTRREHLTLREAAERMGRSREATKKLYTRALAKLRVIMQADRGGSDAG